MKHSMHILYWSSMNHFPLNTFLTFHENSTLQPTHILQEKLAAMEGQLGFATIVKQSIINLVKPQFPTIEQVAANLNLSVRTLQRRLKAEGLTYKAVLDELRRQFALDYLKNDALSIKEIAYLLDYAESSSFVRSFKRWTGKSPQEFRQIA